ncbi:MAG: YdcF family protein [candidate division KSB1 bacterium]|nr:YdcF family protein [candidate division KSB1 bacterium]
MLDGLIIVLGSPNSECGELYSVAKSRCERAYGEYTQRVGWKLLLTGGYGEHFNTTNQPHAAYLHQYLKDKGVPDQDVLGSVQSKNTIQDASLSRPIVETYKPERILVITSDYHLDRAKYVFECEYADTGVDIEFAAVDTDAKDCEFDLESQILHEQRALTALVKENATG